MSLCSLYQDMLCRFLQPKVHDLPSKIKRLPLFSAVLLLAPVVQRGLKEINAGALNSDFTVFFTQLTSGHHCVVAPFLLFGKKMFGCSALFW